MPTFAIKSAKILGQHSRATEVRVVGNYEGCEYAVRTEIAPGEGLPDTILEGYTANPSPEFVVALHEALVAWEGGELVKAEMRRLCE